MKKSYVSRETFQTADKPSMFHVKHFFLIDIQIEKCYNIIDVKTEEES